VNFSACGKRAYIPAKEAEKEAERMATEWEGCEDAYAYECPSRSAKGTPHWHVTSGRRK
jgi:hypothetical protein